MKSLPKVLVVDDEKDYLSMCAALLRKKGFDVYSLADSYDVFTIIKSFRPDLIVLDIKLGDTDGRMICQRIKSDPATNMIKVILQSAQPKLEKELKECQPEIFLIKPYPMETLINAINVLLNLS